GDPPSPDGDGLLRRQEPRLPDGSPTAERGPASDGSFRGLGRRVLSERLRLGPGPLRRRDRGDLPLLREPPEVVPMDLRRAGPRRKGRVPGPRPARCSRRLRWRAPGLRLRQPEDGRDLPPRRPDPMERHLRSGRPRLPVRRRALHASQGPGEGRCRELGRVCQEELLPGPTVPRPRRPRGTARAVAPRGERGPSLSGDGSDSRGADRRGAGAPPPAPLPPVGVSAPIPRSSGTDGVGAVPRRPLLDAGGGHRHPGDPLPLPGPGADHDRPSRRGPPEESTERREYPTAPRDLGAGRGRGSTSSALLQAPATLRGRSDRRGVPHRAGACAAEHLGRRRPSAVRAAARTRPRADGRGVPARARPRLALGGTGRARAGAGAERGGGGMTELDAMLARLHMPTVRRLWSDLQVRAEKEGMGYAVYLETLMGEEIAHRQQTRVQRETRWARFPFLRTIEEFD